MTLANHDPLMGDVLLVDEERSRCWCSVEQWQEICGGHARIHAVHHCECFQQLSCRLPLLLLPLSIVTLAAPPAVEHSILALLARELLRAITTNTTLINACSNDHGLVSKAQRITGLATTATLDMLHHCLRLVCTGKGSPRSFAY